MYERYETTPHLRPRWQRKLGAYWRLMRADRPIGWLLLLWPTWWGLWLAAGGWPGWHMFIVFTLGVWLTRGAGCVINDYADRWLDGNVERTKSRPLVTGEVSSREALGLFVVLMLMAFAAIQDTVPPLAWLLYVANILWATAYDTWYAMVDRDDDLRVGAKSTAILFGELDLVAQGVLYALMFLALGLVGQRAGMGMYYWAGLALAAMLVAWEFRIARHRDRDACFRAFLHNNWVGMAIFAGIAADFAFGPHG